MPDVMVDTRMSNIAVCFRSPHTVEDATQDAMMSKAITQTTVGDMIQKHVVSCHQPPWKHGCLYGIGENRGGADKHGRRYCYECTSCGSKWNQTRPELLSKGEDPIVRKSNRCTNVSDKRRSNGYKCRDCGGKKNPAQSAGMLTCSCQRKANVRRPGQSSSVASHIVVLATRMPSTAPFVRGVKHVHTGSAVTACFAKAVRKHPRMKPFGIPLSKWRKLLVLGK